MPQPSLDLAIGRFVLRQHSDKLLALPNVVGFGLGPRTVRGRRKDEWCVQVMVSKKVSAAALADDQLVPRQLRVRDGSIVTDVIEVGTIRLIADTQQYRPLQGGIQIAGSAIGTLGAVLYDRTDGKAVMLTCNHCLTIPGQRNSIPARSMVYQPASNPDSIGNVKRIVPMLLPPLGNINVRSVALVDAGIVAPLRGITLPAVTVPGVDAVFRVVDLGRHVYVILEPAQGMSVRKRGWRTELTDGTIECIDLTFVTTDTNGDQLQLGGVGSGFSIRAPSTGPFALKGDSGSLVTDSPGGGSVGIVCASDELASGLSFACSMGAICEALNVESSCTGGPRRFVRHAVDQRRLAMRMEPAPDPLLERLDANFERFCGRLAESEAGSSGAVVNQLFRALAPLLAQDLESDDEFLANMLDAFAPLVLKATVHEMFETRIDAGFQRGVGCALERFVQLHPEFGAPIRTLHDLLPTFTGASVRDLLASKLSATTYEPSVRGTRKRKTKRKKR